MNRREILLLAVRGTVPIAFGWLAGGCARGSSETGPRLIQWNREACTQCGMVLSDRRFAVQMQGGATHGHWNFDDIGCALTWLAERGWPAAQQPMMWVADFGGEAGGNAGGDAASRASGEPRWLAAQRAHYTAGRGSPMGYGFGASEVAVMGSVGFDEMRHRVLSQRMRMS